MAYLLSYTALTWRKVLVMPFVMPYYIFYTILEMYLRLFQIIKSTQMLLTSFRACLTIESPYTAFGFYSNTSSCINSFIVWMSDRKQEKVNRGNYVLN